jgi:hypothetical protein
MGDRKGLCSNLKLAPVKDNFQQASASKYPYFLRRRFVNLMEEKE